MSRVDIGFVEKCEPWRLECRFFPSKIGGRPSWLDLGNLPHEKNVRCSFCGKPCVFLSQVYAPYEEEAKAFHRTIYVFVCRSPECCRLNENGNLRVLRSQLERENKFYPSEPPEERENWRPDISAEKWSKNCGVCGIFAPSHCSRCKKMYYCSREHQVLDWKHGHKSLCGTSTVAPENRVLFPEYELVTEPEEASGQNSEDEDPVNESRELKEYEKMVQDGRAGTLQDDKSVDADLLKMATEAEDETFFEFTSRIKRYPDQVLRYDRGGSALYVSSQNQPSEIPRCQECGGERQFEFQIMPQLLNYLKFEDTLNSLDWGTLAVFTCKNSCVPKNGYSPEYIWKQDIVEEKVDDSLNNKTSSE